MNLEEEKYIESINASSEAFIDFGTEKISTDLYEMAESVDFFMRQYGMGGCRSFSEFWNMVDSEDPVKLMLLRIAANERIRKENGDNSSRSYTSSSSVNKSHKNKYKASRTVDNDDIMRNFLIDMGADRNKVEAAVKSKNQKIKYHDDMSDINRDNLFSSDFDFKGGIERINKAVSHTKVFEVSSATMTEAQSGVRKSNKSKS